MSARRTRLDRATEWRAPSKRARLGAMSTSAKRMMHLGAFVHETGQHVAAWRHPEAHYHSGVRFADMVETAQLAERGKMDFLFLADSAAVDLEGSSDARGRMDKVVKSQHITILSALT